jgi:hypothetical protein
MTAPDRLSTVALGRLFYAQEQVNAAFGADADDDNSDYHSRLDLPYSSAFRAVVMSAHEQ